MGRFSGLGNAKVGGGGVYFLAGLYKVEVTKVFMMTSRKREEFFVVEAKIIESNNDKRTPGMGCGWMVKMSQDAALGNIKGFIAAAMDADPADKDLDEDWWEEQAEAAVDKDNPLEGVEINLEVVDITTREGNPFSLHKWSSAA